MGHRAYVYPGFDAWSEDHGISTPWGDADNDGFTNLQEFARLSDPQSPTLASTDAFINSAGRPGFRFGHRQDVDFQVERSSDLLSWTLIEPTDIEKTSAADGAEFVTALIRGSLADGTPEFLGVLITATHRLSSPNRSDIRELYIKGDADLVERNETGHMNKVYHVSNLPPGMATFTFQAPSFIPYMKLLDRDSGEVIMEAAGSAKRHSLITSVITESDKDYTLVISSLERPPTEWFTFHYPRLLNSPQYIEVNRQPAVSVLNTNSDLDRDGNYYGKSYQILGTFTGQTITVTLRSDPAQGGFRPYLVIQNDEDPVARTAGEPETSTSVSFVVEEGKTYFAFASTFLPLEQGNFTLTATRL
ncbi:MAG: hypothetical protein ACI957_005044 [Verrucomicrobiales bacterium]|jgi:hypothetical protein